MPKKNDFKTASRLVVSAKIEQLQSLNVGGNVSDGKSVQELCLDGQGRYTIRGESIAGALVSTCRKLLADKNDALPKELSSGCLKHRQNQSADPIESCWRVENSHPIDVKGHRNKDGVAISDETNASIENHLFATEVIPTCTQWPLVLDIDLMKKNSDVVANYVCQALALWEQGLGWIGAQASRGLGRIKLVDVEIYVLTKSAILEWPNSFCSPLDTIEKWRNSKLRPGGISKHNLSDIFTPAEHDSHLFLLTIPITFNFLKDADDSYGFSPVAISELPSPDIKPNLEYMQKPTFMDEEVFASKYFDPDKVISLDHNNLPVLHGSAIRASIKRAMRRFVGCDEQQIVAWFGFVDETNNTTKSGCVLPTDAHLTNEKNYNLAWLHSHTEDEFTAGTYESSKFDQVLLIAGEFNSTIFFEGTNGECNAFFSAIKTIKPFAEAGFLKIGGGETSGMGQLNWAIDDAEPINYKCLVGKGVGSNE
jgi:hypothetical protein